MKGNVESQEGRSRRDLLKAFGAAAAGAVAGGVLNAEGAEAGHGIINASSDSDRPAIHAEHTNGEIVGGVAIEARADPDYGTAIRVTSADTGVDIDVYGSGIKARCVEFDCIRGFSALETGVRGIGVTGVAGNGTEVGVFGFGGDPRVTPGIGVRGLTQSGVGVEAEALEDNATALRVLGSAQFSTAGSGTIAAGQDSASVTNATVTALSHITVTLTGDPGQASSSPGAKPVVAWVERQPGTGFVVHMSRPVRFATPFTYLIVEPV